MGLWKSGRTSTAASVTDRPTSEGGITVQSCKSLGKLLRLTAAAGIVWSATTALAAGGGAEPGKNQPGAQQRLSPTAQRSQLVRSAWTFLDKELQAALIGIGYDTTTQQFTRELIGDELLLVDKVLGAADMAPPGLRGPG